MDELACVISYKTNSIKLWYDMNAALVVVSEMIRCGRIYYTKETTYFDATPLGPTR